MDAHEFEEQREQGIEAEHARLRAEGAAAERAAIRDNIAYLRTANPPYAHLNRLADWLDSRDAQDRATVATGVYWGGRSYSRGELERAVAAAEKDVLAPFRGKIVAFPVGLDPLILEDRMPAGRKLTGWRFDFQRQEETPEERARREGREEGAAQERAQIAAWLRLPRSPKSPLTKETGELIASLIEDRGRAADPDTA